MSSTVKRALSLTALGLGALSLAIAAGTPPATRSAPRRGVREALERARLEQELLVAERTAVMLGDFETSLRWWAETLEETE